MDEIRGYLSRLQGVLQELPLDDIRDVVAVLHYARLNDKQVFIMGNGGSAATASHFACDLGKNLVIPGRPRFRVMALTDNMPLFSALANDYGYEHVFAEQLANLVRAGDIVIGISGSGNSANVLNALELARGIRATTIGFTGFDGGKLMRMVDVCVLVPSSSMEQVEDIHLVLEHLMTTALRVAIAEGGYPLPEHFAVEPWGLRRKEAGEP
jgi:D-sedoheptulose 7-phosphate isomerase